MQTIRSWDDLSAFGIVPLTGEACGLSYRLLCDVTAQGKKPWKRALDVALTPSPRELEQRRPEPTRTLVESCCLPTAWLSSPSSPSSKTIAARSG